MIKYWPKLMLYTWLSVMLSIWILATKKKSIWKKHFFPEETYKKRLYIVKSITSLDLLYSMHKNRAEYVNHKIVSRRVKRSNSQEFYQQPEEENTTLQNTWWKNRFRKDLKRNKTKQNSWLDHFHNNKRIKFCLKT